MILTAIHTHKIQYLRHIATFYQSELDMIWLLEALFFIKLESIFKTP